MLINAGKGIELDVDVSALPEVARDHAIKIGLRNILMDSHASITKEEYPDDAKRAEAARAVVDKKLAALMAGDVRVSGTRGPRAVDAVAKEVKRLATVAINDAVIAKYGTKVAKDMKTETRNKLVADYMAKHSDKLRATAEANLAAVRESADDVDLGELGLD